MHFKSRRLPFGSQSRERRKAAFISVKSDSRCHAGVLGGLFSTDDYLHGKNGWIDCFFLGSKPPVFYNCVIDTTRNAYKEQVRELAYEQSYALVPPSERSLFDHAVKDPISGLWAISLPEEERFAALDGFVDEHFVNLLRAEGLDTLPKYLAERINTLGSATNPMTPITPQPEGATT